MIDIAGKLLAAYCAHGGINVAAYATLEKLDIIYYAFGKVSGTDIVFNYPEDLKRIKQIKADHPHIKVILSIGGGGCALNMTEATLNDDNFYKVTNNIFKTMLYNGFDGIDLDWEFPTVTGHPEEKQKHTEMLKTLREKINNLQGNYTLSVACPDGLWTFKITELEKSHLYLDYINVMTYDMTDFHFTSHHTAPYSSIGSACFVPRSVYNSIQVFKEKGVPLEKILIGGAFYSKKWSNIKGGENGLGVYTDVDVSYGPSVSEIRNNYINKNGYRHFWDERAQAPYLYDGDTFITYDDERSLKCKCGMVKSEKTGGIMIWELSGDKEQILLPQMREWIDN